MTRWPTVQRSITNLAIECGLATESKSGNLSITRATRALKFMAELGLITYQTEYDPRLAAISRPISPSRRHFSPRSTSLTWLLWLRAAAAWNGKISSAKSRT
jgi:incFII family plasmid replication initiator RepA